jgi:hypothetical protein
MLTAAAGESNLVVQYVAQSLYWPSYTGPSVQILS